MGLDMYLTGEVFFWEARKRGDRKGELFDLGYWRKHPNLHGFIVQTFANSVDQCQQINLSAADIRRIIEAVNARQLPVTLGFFFGVSDGSEREEDLQIFSHALEWLAAASPNESRQVYYQASW